MTGVDVVDPATVQIRLSQPFAPLAALLADRSGMVMLRIPQLWKVPGRGSWLKTGRA